MRLKSQIKLNIGCGQNTHMLMNLMIHLDVMEEISVNKFALLLLFPTSCFAGSGADACYAELTAYIAESPVSKKLGTSVTEASFEQLASKEVATEQDKPSIAKIAESSKKCNSIEISEMPSDVHPGFPEIFKESEDKKQSLLIDLYNGELTYGDYLRSRQSDIAASNKKLTNLVAEIEYNNKVQANNQRVQKSQAWADFFGGMSRAYAPRGSTNCSPNGTGGFICYKQ